MCRDGRETAPERPRNGPGNGREWPPKAHDGDMRLFCRGYIFRNGLNCVKYNLLFGGYNFSFYFCIENNFTPCV